jgi:Flp pilus assembly pilin Flp
MNRLIPLYVTLSTFVSNRAERMKSREDRGASMIEYGALLILISAIIAALIASDIDGIIGTKVKELVNQIFSGGQAK